MPAIDPLASERAVNGETVHRWSQVARESIRRLAWMHGDRDERARRLRALEREAGDLAGILETPFRWTRKEGQ